MQLFVFKKSCNYIAILNKIVKKPAVEKTECRNILAWVQNLVKNLVWNRTSTCFWLSLREGAASVHSMYLYYIKALKSKSVNGASFFLSNVFASNTVMRLSDENGGSSINSSRHRCWLAHQDRWDKSPLISLLGDIIFAHTETLLELFWKK